MTEEEELVSKFDKRVERTKKYFKGSTSTRVLPSRELLLEFVVPLIEDLRDDLAEAIFTLEDRIDEEQDGGANDVIENAKALISAFSVLVDDCFKKIGWVIPNEEDGSQSFSPQVPEDLKMKFEEVQKMIAQWGIQLKIYNEGEEEET